MPRSRRSTARLLARLTMLVALLGLFFWAPIHVAGWRSTTSPSDQGEIVDLLTRSFVADWRSAGSARTAEMDSLVSYWMRFHLVKAVVSIALLASVADVVRRLLRTGRDRLAVAACVPGGLALVAVLANLQGALAPGASLVSMLPLDDDGPLAEVLPEVRQSLAAASAPAALVRLVDDFAWYHWVFAVLAAGAALALAAGAVRAWRGGADGAQAGTPRVGMAVVLALGCAVSATLAAANVSNARHPVDGIAIWLDQPEASGTSAPGVCATPVPGSGRGAPCAPVDRLLP